MSVVWIEPFLSKTLKIVENFFMVLFRERLAGGITFQALEKVKFGWARVPLGFSIRLLAGFPETGDN